MPVVGSLGEYVFTSGITEAGTTFNALNVSRASRLASHSTVAGLPVVEVLGVDSMRVTLSGVISAQFTRDADEAVARLMSLQDGKARALTRGLHCFGLFVVSALKFSEDAWSGQTPTPASISWTMDLIQTRGAV